MNRGIAYALHLFLGLLTASIPLLGLLQDAGVVTHGFAQGWGMMIVLGLGVPALVLAPVALVFSVLPRPRDPALLLLAALLLLLAAATLFEMAEPDAFFVVGAYVLAALGFGGRWVLSLWRKDRLPIPRD